MLETFHLVSLKQSSCPFSLLKEREEKDSTKCNWKPDWMSCRGGGGAIGPQPSCSSKVEKEFSLFLCSQGALRSIFCWDRWDYGDLTLLPSSCSRCFVLLYGCSSTTPPSTSKIPLPVGEGQVYNQEGASWGGRSRPSMPENKNHWFRTMGPRLLPLFDHLMGWVPFEALALRGEEGRPGPCTPGTLFRALIVDTNHRSNTASAAFPRTTTGPRRRRWWQDGGGGTDS